MSLRTKKDKSLNVSVSMEQLQEKIEEAVSRVVLGANDQVKAWMDKIKDFATLERHKGELLDEVAKLKADKVTREAEVERDRLDIEHKVGLHKIQVEAESEIAVGKAKLEVRESLLDDKITAFEERMEADREAFREVIDEKSELIVEEVKRIDGYVTKLIAAVSKGVPNTDVLVTAGNQPAQIIEVDECCDEENGSD